MIRLACLVVLAGVVVLGTAVPNASAIDLTGTWEYAKGSCKELLANGEKSRRTRSF